MAEIDRGMDVGELKRLLAKSKGEPVNAAFGVDGKNAVIMLDKVKQPKAVSKQLETKFKAIKNLRWGTAAVDPDADPKLVVLTVNRAASGVGRMLRKTLKGTGFTKIRIQLEDGSVAEDAGEEDEEGEGEPEAQPALADAAGLTHRWTDLVKQIAHFPDRADQLMPLAAKAGLAIKAGDPSAAEALDALERQMQSPLVDVSALQKSRLAWIATRKKIEDDVAKLHEAISKHYQGHSSSEDLASMFQKKVEPILISLDQGLADKLDEAAQNQDPGKRSRLLGEARQLIEKYESFLSGEPLLAQLDENPFVPLAIVKTARGTLEALRKSVPAA